MAITCTHLMSACSAAIADSPTILSSQFRGKIGACPTTVLLLSAAIDNDTDFTVFLLLEDKSVSSRQRGHFHKRQSDLYFQL